MKRINQPVSPFLDDELFAEPTSYVARPTQFGLHEPDEKDELEFEEWEWEDNDGESDHDEFDENESAGGFENALQEFDVYTSDNELDPEQEGFEQQAWAEQLYREADAESAFLADEDDEFSHEEYEYTDHEGGFSEDAMSPQHVADEFDISDAEEFFVTDDFDNAEEEATWLNEELFTGEMPAIDTAFLANPEEQEASTTTALRQRIVQIAKGEWAEFGRGTRGEDEYEMAKRIQMYYAKGIRRNISEKQVRNGWHRRHPWSAAFISYVMRMAGAGDDAFRYSAGHAYYIAAAKQATSERDPSKFQAFEISMVKPEIGDLVCRDRTNRKGKCTGTNFDNVKGGRSSHADIVVEVHSDYIVTVGGNTSQRFPQRNRRKGGFTVGQRKVMLNAQGYVDIRQGTCKYFAIVKPPGFEASKPTMQSDTGAITSLPEWIANIVKGGTLTLQAALAMLSGQRDVNTLTNMIFYARHPHLPVGYKIQSRERELRLSWMRIRDKVVKPLLHRLEMGVSTRSSSLPGSKNAQVNAKTIANVVRYRPLAEAAAKKHGVDSSLILGVIAAESGGNKDLVAKSGYTGLMQANRDLSQKKAAVSIDTGTQKLRKFRNLMENVLKEHGKSYAHLPVAEQICLLVLAYNAGPVSVAKALQYATQAGSPERWLEAEHYKRALLFTGAYSISQAAKSCLKGVNTLESKTRRREAERVRKEWRFAGKGRKWWTMDDPPPWSNVSTDLPQLLVCAIDFKHRNAPKYVAKILAYRDRFLTG